MNFLRFSIITTFLIALFMVAPVNKLQAQVDDNHFIYIQSENRKPFYVIVNGKLYSSSSIGYLIIPKLKSGTYNLTLGFPQNAAPEQKFVSVVKSNDIGYSLKEINKNIYTLTDLQTQEVLLANNSGATTKNEITAKVAPPPPVKKRDETPVVVQQPDPEPVVERVVEEVAIVEDLPVEEAKAPSFSELMSTVANDPDLAKPVEKKQPAKQRDPFEETKIVRTGDANKAETPVVVEEKIQEPVQDYVPAVVKPAPASDTYGVIRTADRKVNQGREMSFVLLSNSSTDSVNIFIPVEEEEMAPMPGTAEAASSLPESNEGRRKSIAYFDHDDLAKEAPPALNIRTRREKKHERFIKETPAAGTNNVDNPFYNGSSSASTSERQGRTSTETNIQVPVKSYNNCTTGEIADKDFNKMRNKMIGRDNDEEMVSTALDMLGKKCISTARVKTLGGLFITDTGRLRFFNAVYNNVSDKENVATLESLLYDKGKKDEFRRLIK